MWDGIHTKYCNLLVCVMEPHTDGGIDCSSYYRPRMRDPAYEARRTGGFGYNIGYIIMPGILYNSFSDLFATFPHAFVRLSSHSC